MSKKLSVIVSIVIAVLGSLVTFYACNLFFADVANVANGFNGPLVLISVTALMLGALFVTGLFYVARLYRRPKTLKKLSSTYLFVAMGLSFVGLLTAILGGVIAYGNLASPYPFPGYCIIMMVIHLLVLGGSIFAFIKFVRPLPADEEQFKVSAKHVFYTLGWFLFVSLAFNRFGAFLFLPSYVYLRNLYETFAFFLFLLVPMAMLVKKGLDVYEIKYNQFIVSCALLGAAIVLLIPIIIIASQDTMFVSSVSLTMPLDRLAAKPVEFLLHLLSYFGLLIFWFVKALLAKKAK